MAGGGCKFLSLKEGLLLFTGGILLAFGINALNLGLSLSATTPLEVLVLSKEGMVKGADLI